MTVITWNTTTTAAGFEWKVIEVGYQVDTKVLKTGKAATRARATGQAKRWSRYLKAVRKSEGQSRQ